MSKRHSNVPSRSPSDRNLREYKRTTTSVSNISARVRETITPDIQTIDTIEGMQTCLDWTMSHGEEWRNRVGQGGGIRLDGIAFSDGSPTLTLLKKLLDTLHFIHKKPGWITILPTCSFQKGMDLNEMLLEYVRLDRVDMSGVKLNGAKLRRAELKNANLNRADLSQADFRETKLHDAEFKYAYLFWANVEGAEFLGAKLHHAYIKDVRWWDATIRRAEFNEAEGLPERHKEKWKETLKKEGAYA